MSDADNQGISEQELRALEVRVEELVRACGHLKDENRRLRLREQNLLAERAGLVAKTEQARARVEAMISRLRSLEANT